MYEGGEVRGGVASEATMNFEGSKAHAVGEGQIKKLLAVYTSYVSMDSTDNASSGEMESYQAEEEYVLLPPL